MGRVSDWLNPATCALVADQRAPSQPTHSSGSKPPDIADIAIDNCVPPEDALMDIGQPEKVADDWIMAGQVEYYGSSFYSSTRRL